MLSESPAPDYAERIAEVERRALAGDTRAMRLYLDVAVASDSMNRLEARLAELAGALAVEVPDVDSE